MKFSTYGEIRAKVQADLDLQDDELISPDEWVGLFNDAVTELEGEIVKLGCEQDYFRTSGDLTFVQGQAKYNLDTLCPTIMGQKLRGIVYSVGTLVYPIEDIRRLKKFIKIADIIQFGQGDFYRFDITSDMTSRTSNDPTFNITFYPTPRESAVVGTVWWIRSANRAPLVTAGSQGASDATKLDIPESRLFVEAHMKAHAWLKKGDPRADEWKGNAQTAKDNLVATLTPQVVDDNDRVQLDTSLYQEMN